MYQDEEYDIQELEKILGSPLPEIDPIYKDGCKIYGENDKHPLISQYFLSRMFNPEQMRMVMCLPGTSKEVADKLGLNPDYVEVQLRGLFRRGRLMPGRKYHMETRDVYVPIRERVTQGDYLTMAFFRERRDLAEEEELFKLSELWGNMMFDPTSPKTKAERKLGPKAGGRIIPKWGSIKDLPGVMHCENMKEIYEENFKNGTMGWQKCVCRARKDLQRTGSSFVKEGSTCISGLKEYDQKDGHCLWFGDQRSKYMKEQFDIHICKDHDELMKHFQDGEDALVIYTSAGNRRHFGNACVCCPDCCGIYQAYKKGIYNYNPSRFQPYCIEDKCVGCKLCQTRCMFSAITYNENGKATINPEECVGCGNCVIKCPTKALKMKVVHDVDWIPDIEDYA